MRVSTGENANLTCCKRSSGKDSPQSVAEDAETKNCLHITGQSQGVATAGQHRLHCHRPECDVLILRDLQRKQGSRRLSAVNDYLLFDRALVQINK